MKGKRLYHLIETLDASEGKTIINICKQSNDKRHRYLHDVLSKRPYEDFEKLNTKIENCFIKNGKLSPTLDKSIRRFIDFACKEIEYVKVNKRLQLDELPKNMILVQEFLGSSNGYLLDYYLDKAFAESKKRDDIISQSICLDNFITSFAKVQTDKATQQIKKLAEQKVNFIRELYHRNQSEYYNIVSNMYIDDSSFIENAILPSLENFQDLIEETKDSIYSIVYELSLARLHFSDEAFFKQHIENCERRVSSVLSKSDEKQKWTRRVLFTKISAGFHFGWPMASLTATVKKNLEHNESYKYYDDATLFYYLFLLVLQGKSDQVNKLINGSKLKYFKNDNNEMLILIRSLVAYAEEDYKTLKQNLNNLTSGDSFYINIWSRLLEILYWLKKRDEDFALNLIGRTERYLNINKNKVFTGNDNALVLAHFKKLAMGTKIKSSEIIPNLKCDYHKYLVSNID